MTRKKIKKLKSLKYEEDYYKLKSFQILPDSYLLIVKPNIELFLDGFVKVSVLQGSCSVHGNELKSNSSPICVLSTNITGIYSLLTYQKPKLEDDKDGIALKSDNNTIILLQGYHASLSNVYQYDTMIDTLNNAIQNIFPDQTNVCPQCKVSNQHTHPPNHCSQYKNLRTILTSPNFSQFWAEACSYPMTATFSKISLAQVTFPRSRYFSSERYFPYKVSDELSPDSCFVMDHKSPESHAIHPKSPPGVGVSDPGSDGDDVQIIDDIAWEDDSSVEVLREFFGGEGHEKGRPAIQPFDTSHSDNLIRSPGCADEAVAHFVEPNKYRKVIICGKQGVGKSTLARYLTNRLTSRPSTTSANPEPPAKGVVWMECDVGQPQYHPAGFMSLVQVGKGTANPTVGPSWLQRSPFVGGDGMDGNPSVLEAQYYGFTTPSQDPILYLQLIHNMYQLYATKYAKNNALIVNTNGWFKGLGLFLLCQTISLVQPTSVIHVIKDDEPSTPISCSNGDDDTSPTINIKEFISNDVSIRTFLNSTRHLFHNDRTDDTRHDDEMVAANEVNLPTFEYIIERRKCYKERSTSPYNSKLKKLGAARNRTMLLASYFADLLVFTTPDSSQRTGDNLCPTPPAFYPGCLLKCTPFKIGFDQLDQVSLLSQADLPTQMIPKGDRKGIEQYALSTIVGKLVALCQAPVTQASTEQRSEEIQHRVELSSELNLRHTSFGLGLIRNIDYQARVLHIVSPISVTHIAKVNYIVKGCIELPKEFLEIFLGQRLVQKGNQAHNQVPVTKSSNYEFLSYPVKTKRNDPKFVRRQKKKNN